MLDAIITFSVSAGIIVFSGYFLTRFADGIADATGWGRLLVGSIFLAGATSLPELMVDVSAAHDGHVDIAVGGIVGSSLFNLLILAGVAMLPSVRGRILSSEFASHSLPLTMSIFLTAIAGVGMLLNSEWVWMNLGAGSFVMVLAYFYCIRMVFSDQKARAAEAEKEELPETEAKPGLIKPLLGYLACAAVILLAAPKVASSASIIAKETGLGDTFIGTTMVALATSLPELVTSIGAIRLKAYDLALGNIFGSNSFNMLLLAPVDYFYTAGTGSLLSDAESIQRLTCFAAVAVSCVALMALLGKRKDKGVTILQPGAPMMALMVIASLVLIYFMK